VPTYWHLLCAELELRAADTRALPAALRAARRRTLDRLRDYRRRREFPHNTGVPKGYSPCSIDDQGRQCAVAHLMHASGAAEAARGVARVANYARIAEMPAAALDGWAAASGLTRAELARIQPSYLPDPEPLRPYYETLVAFMWVVGALGVLSIVGNTLRLLGTSIPRSIARAGVWLGVALLCLGFAAHQLQTAFSSGGTWADWQEHERADAAYRASLATYEVTALVVGLASSGVAVLTYGLGRRGKKTGAGGSDRTPTRTTSDERACAG
jgi:hypothetical protein